MEHARKLITTHQFNNEPFRILLASLSSGLRATDAFITSTLQKHLFREIKMADAAVKDPGLLKWNPVNKRYALTSQGKTSGTGVTNGADEDDARDDDMDDVVTTVGGGESQEIVGAPKIPTKHNPIIVTIYGQICIAARSYQSAICMSFAVGFSSQNDVCFLRDSLSSPRLRLLSRRSHGLPLLSYSVHRACDAETV